jgi:hypothetical protein
MNFGLWIQKQADSSKDAKCAKYELNCKLEIQNSKQIQMAKKHTIPIDPVLDFRFLDLSVLVCFGIRASVLGF